MARDYYETTIALPDAAAGNAMKPLSGVKVSLVPRGAVDPVASIVDVFQGDTGAAKGPDPKSGASGTVPFTTGASGSVRFWADGPAEYDIVFEDLTIPARITDRVGWNCVPAKPGSLSTSLLAPDGGIKQNMLSAEVIMQQEPIGGITDWWRAPGTSPPGYLPAGYEVADGRNLVAGQHEFPVAGAVTLPNLQNVFILGATAAKGDGTGAGNDDLPGSGPGIRGTGGSNKPKDLRHSHTTPMHDHYHGFNLPNHYHLADGLTTGAHSHGVSTAANTGDGNRSRGPVASGSGEGVAYTAHQHYVAAGGGTDQAGNIGVYGNVNWASATPGWPFTSSTGYIQAWGSGQNGYMVSSATSWALTTAGANQATFDTEFRPNFYGLLRLIKVRRTA